VFGEPLLARAGDGEDVVDILEPADLLGAQFDAVAVVLEGAGEDFQPEIAEDGAFKSGAASP